MIRLIFTEMVRTWILYRRYPMNYFSGLFVMLFTFYGLIMGAQFLGGNAFAMGDRLDGVILGYWLWNLAIFAFTYTAATMQTEAIAGTLEQLFLSSFGALRIFLARILASLVINIVTSTLLLLVMLILTGRTLSFPLEIILPLASAVMAAYGIGLMVGGAALVFKQVSRFMTIVQFMLLPLVVVPFDEVEGIDPEVFNFLPMEPSAALLRSLMARGEALDLTQLAISLGNGVGHMLLGVLVFHWAVKTARKHALLGQF